jgi:hypothetical protein
MKATENGFIYKANKEVVTEIFTGDGFALPEGVFIFYGTKDEALDFGLIFIEQ